MSRPQPSGWPEHVMAQGTPEHTSREAQCGGSLCLGSVAPAGLSPFTHCNHLVWFGFASPFWRARKQEAGQAALHKPRPRWMTRCAIPLCGGIPG